jgi:hypothetical protein
VNAAVGDDVRGSSTALGERLLGRPWHVAVAAGVVAIVIVAVLIAANGHGVSGLVHAAPPWTDPARVPSSLAVRAPGHGFDGQFFYRVAISPFSEARRVAGVTFDLPALREQRITYPLLTRLVSGGNRDAVPYGLVAVNVAAMAALGWLGACLARTTGRSAAWGLLFPLFPGFVYSLGFDLAEVVAATFVLGGLVALRTDRAWLAVISLTLAAFTRETTLVVPLGLAIAGAWPRWRSPDPTERRVAVTVGLVPLVLFGAWQLWLRSQWGTFAVFDSGGENVRVPFAGLVGELGRFVPTGSGALLRDLSFVFLVLIVVTGLLALPQSAARHHEQVAFVLAVLLLPLLGDAIWRGATTFTRASTEVYTIGMVILLSARRPALRIVTAATMATLFATVVAEVVKAA